MKIYVTHSTGFDFRTELYAPLKTFSNDKFVFIFPHEDDTFRNSKAIIPACDIVLAEVSHPSTGQGIELGWANNSGIPIVCIHKSDTKISSSLAAVSETFIAYSSAEDMLRALGAALS